MPKYLIEVQVGFITQYEVERDTMERAIEDVKAVAMQEVKKSPHCIIRSAKEVK